MATKAVGTGPGCPRQAIGHRLEHYVLAFYHAGGSGSKPPSQHRDVQRINRDRLADLWQALDRLHHDAASAMASVFPR
jgi:hypothetical protein